MGGSIRAIINTIGGLAALSETTAQKEEMSA